MECYVGITFKCFKSLGTFNFYSHCENIFCNAIIKFDHNSEKDILNSLSCIVAFEKNPLHIHQNKFDRLIDLISCYSSS